MTGPVRVVLVTTELRPAGAERVVYDLATRLDRRRFEPVVLALMSVTGDDGGFAPKLRAAGVTVFPLRVRSKLDLVRVVPLVQILKRVAPRILHAHLFHANLVARLVAPLVGRPRVISTHHVVERRQLGPRFFLDRATAPLDDRTVAVSHACARFAVSTGGARPDRLVVVEDGIDLAPLRGTRTDGPTLRAALGVGERTPLVGAVGRLNRQKGHVDLIRAWPRVSRAFPDAVLAIAGEGPERQALERLASDLGVANRVKLVGHSHDVPGFLVPLNVFVMPSRWEGFGLALVEALAAGKACVTSDADSLPEVLGEAGVFVPAADPAALAEAIVRLLGAPRERERLAGLARARAERFSVERMVAAYEDLYEQVLRVT